VSITAELEGTAYVLIHRMTVDQRLLLAALSPRERQWFVALEGRIAHVGSKPHLVQIVGIHTHVDDVWIQLATFDGDVAGMLLRCSPAATAKDALSAVSRHLAEPLPRAYTQVNVVSAATEQTPSAHESQANRRRRVVPQSDAMSETFIRRFSLTSAAEPTPQHDLRTRRERC
jgi:hypothetical protein